MMIRINLLIYKGKKTGLEKIPWKRLPKWKEVDSMARCALWLEWAC